MTGTRIKKKKRKHNDSNGKCEGTFGVQCIELQWDKVAEARINDHVLVSTATVLLNQCSLFNSVEIL